ncbi:MAG TPA: nucleotidyltransferase [Lentisphaeria bacterium]|nr:MAG: nucleotidyltransferase [Lentisphaerae bacterium GWF2_38_69]HBM14873.1 nucleotidyltransferase [Lentisphaeria bacterium]
MELSLVVLAAGMGSRYGGLKQIDPVGPGGESIMDYSIFDAARAGFDKVVFIIRRDIEEEFKKVIGEKYKSIINVEYAFQEKNRLPTGFVCPEDRIKPWGTGHAILMAQEIVKGPFAVINADDFYGKRSFELLASYLKNAKDCQCADYCMIGFILNNTLSSFGYVSRGVCTRDVQSYLVNVKELTHIEPSGNAAKYLNENEKYELLSGNEIVSMNMWGFTESIFHYLESLFKEFLKSEIRNPKSEFYIPFVVDRLIKENEAKVKVLESKDKWFGITYKEDKPEVISKLRSLVDSGVYPSKLYLK